MVTRWDPSSRAGAMAVRRKRPFDLGLVEEVAAAVHDWATYQDLAGEFEGVEPSPIQGSYDWRAYLAEETRIAKRRAENAKSKSGVRAPEPSQAPVPHDLYA